MMILQVAVTLARVVTSPVIDPGTVQSVAAVEVAATPTCTTLQDKDGRPCGVTRKVELRRALAERAVAIINASATPKACREAPTHAFVVHTTRGTRVVPISLRCGTIGGRGFTSPAIAGETRDFLRGQGLTTGL
jgi:hypothetical protein